MPFIRPLKFEAYNLATRLFGRHVEPEFKLLAAFAPVDLALDIGGNWGQSIHALQRTARPSRVVSFEPDQPLAERLERRFGRDQSVSIHNVALGDKPGHFTLYTPRYRQYVYDGLASLKREEAAEWLRGRMAGFDPAKLTILEQRVEVRTLDSFNLSPSVVKIDVQGAELDVVKGGLETMRRCRPVAIIEAPSEELVDLFATLGMTAHSLVDGRLSPHWRGSTNVLFLSDERRRALGI